MIHYRTASFYLKRSLLKLVFNVPWRHVIQKVKLLWIIIQGERLRKKSENKYQVSIPQFCILSVTNRCNLKCKGCYASGYTGTGMLNEANIDKIIKEATGLGIYMFVIAGGEPLLVKNMVPGLGKYPRAVFLLFTNGLLLDKKIIQQIKSNYNVIPVLSFEGNKDFNDFRRGTGNGKMIDQSLQLLRQNKLLFGFSTMAMHENVDYVISKLYIDKMANNGAAFGFIIDYVATRQKNQKPMCLNDWDMLRKSDELKKRKHDSDMIIFNLPADEDPFNHCGAGKEIIHVNASGYVEPCPFSHYAKDNILQTPLLEILKSDFFSSLRKKMTEMVHLEGRCLLHLNEQTMRTMVKETGAIETVR
jgi:MoaA/NifB/PqqE/SkfB family radical SAM enzyme